MELDFTKLNRSKERGEALKPYPPEDRLRVLEKLMRLATSDPWIFENDEQLGFANGLIAGLRIMQGKIPVFIAKKFQRYERANDNTEGNDKELRNILISKSLDAELFDQAVAVSS